MFKSRRDEGVTLSEATENKPSFEEAKLTPTLPFRKTLTLKNLSNKQTAIIIEIVRNARPDTQALYIFGSYADGTAGAMSDVDLAVRTSEPMSSMEVYELRQELAAQLNQDVDLIDLREAAHLVCNEVVQKGERLFRAPEFDVDRYELLVISRFLDFQEGTRELRADIQKRGFVHG